jgi:hypothetical protein
MFKVVRGKHNFIIDMGVASRQGAAVHQVPCF